MRKVQTASLVLLWGLLCTARAGAVEFPVDSIAEPVPITGVWRFHSGDDLAWAAPDFDHGRWDNILVPRDWRRQGYENYSGMAWYRAEIGFDLSAPELAADLHQLGVTIGRVHSAYEIYAGGELIGSSGALPPDPVSHHDRKRIYAIPLSAIDDNGRLMLAVRVWREPALGPASTSGMYEGDFLVGTVFDLTKEVWFDEVFIMILVIAYAVIGLYHLYLYGRNRKIPEFLWFGVTTLLVALYSLEVSQWKYVSGSLEWLPLEAHRKIEYGTIYLLPAVGLQLVWSLLHFQPPRWVLFYQSGFVFFALVAVAIPGTDIHVHTLFFWQLYVIPGLVGALLQVVWFAANGHKEARTMTLGWALFLFAALNDILVAQGVVQNPRYLTLGFAAVLLSMGLSLANRFTRMYSDLDGEVRDRTSELRKTNEKLSEAARLDTLTGLLNRRGFAEKIEVEIARAGRTQRNFVLLMADVDHFKAFNDQHGHACGDFVLRETADLLRAQLRDVDTIARWGGEEFIFLLPETSLDGGAVLAEKLRAVLEGTKFNYDGIILSLTITLGVAQFRKGLDLDGCLALADAALYKGKQEGRNRIVVDESFDVEPGASEASPGA
jgi:diguanylate cyclase (GGDEF)-like protein